MTAPGEIDLHTFADGRLVKVAGGTSLYIPVQIYPGTKLATLIGEKNAKALVAAHGGEIIEVPLGRKRSRHPERQSIVRTLLTRQALRPGGFADLSRSPPDGCQIAVSDTGAFCVIAQLQHPVSQ